MSKEQLNLFDAEERPTLEPIFQIIKFDSGITLTLEEHVGLGKQLRKILEYMVDGNWHSIDAIANDTGTKITSADAQVRNLRKEKHGGFDVEYQRQGNVAHYRLNLNR